MGIFDFLPGEPTYEAVERRRALANALGMQAVGAQPATVGQGFSALGAALGGALANRGAERMDTRRAALGDAAFEAALNGIPQDNSPLAAALGGAYGAPVSASVPPVQATALAPSGNPLRDGIVETAQAIGANPLDLATAISYETAGTFDPTKAGPTTQWGQHRGLIQFGEPQAKQYGVDWSDPIGSQLGANGAIANYFRDRGFKPGMSGLDLYSTINAGSPGRYSASDANNGGAPGTVADKWSQQMAPHRKKAMSLLGGDYQPAAPSAAAPAMAPMSLPAPPPVNVALIRAMNNPHMTPEQKQILGGIYQQQMAMQITPYQQAQLQMAQQEHALRMQQAMQPEPVKPIAINGQLVNPMTGQVLGDYRDEAGAGGTEYGLQPQYGVDDQGNPVLIQIGKDGTAVQTKLPENVRFQKEPIRIDAGTEWVLLDPISRQPIGSIAKNLAEAEAEKASGAAQGKATAEAQAGLSSAVAKADQAIGLLTSIRDDPALPSITGMFQGRVAPMTQAGTDLNVKIEQAQGQVFLEAFQSLKGGGAITEVEGKKAEQAIARMSRAQSTEAYQAGLNELIGVIEAGKQRALQKAGQAAPTPVAPAAQAAPPATTVDDPLGLF